MWLIRTSAIVLGVGFAVLGSGAVAAQAPPYAPLPAPITIEAGRVLGSASYRIGRDGRPHRIHRLPPPWSFPVDSAYGPASGIWWAVRHGHLAIGRGSRRLWLSRGEFRTAYGIGAIEIGARTVAFSYGNNLYLAPRRGAERRIGRAEYALGFTRGGLYTLSWVHGLLLRSDTGAILKTLMHWTPGPVAVRGRLYFVDHGVLMTARGAGIERLGSLAGLGMSRDVGLQPVGGLLELMDGNRLILLHPDGSVFASTLIPRSHGQSDTISSSVVAAAHGRAVAFTAAAGESAAPSAALPGHGTDTVYLLRSGAHAAAPLYREPVVLRVCEGVGTSLQWRGGWLLYSDSDKNLVAIDTVGAPRAVDLSRVVARLSGASSGFTAYWSGQPPTF